MNKLMLTAVAACFSMAVTAAYAETNKQDTIRLAQADKEKPAKRTTTKDPGQVSDAATTTPGPSGQTPRTPSGKQRKAGPDAKGVSDAATTTEGPSGSKGRTPSGKQRKAGPDAKSVDDASGAGQSSPKKAEKK
jgi:hypothetical protein